MEADKGVFYKNVLSKTNSDVINQFFHAIVDEICGGKAATFQQFANSVQWTEEEFRIGRKLAFDLFKNPALLYLDEEKMPQSYFEVPSEIQLAIRKCASVRREQLVNALLKTHLIKSGTTLLDFDWRLKWVMGSSKLATLKEPLLQLDLIVEDSKTQQILDLEMNKDELEMLINALEEVER